MIVGTSVEVATVYVGILNRDNLRGGALSPGVKTRDDQWNTYTMLCKNL